MATSQEAIHSFLSQFDMPAYAVGSVPVDAEFPYITFSQQQSPWGVAPITATIWMQTESEAEINYEATKFSKAIGLGGALIKAGDGALWLKRGEPWMINAPSQTNGIKGRLMNIEIESFSTF